MDLASVLEAEDIVEVDANSRAMNVGKAISVSKPAIVIIGEEGVQETIGLVDGGDSLFAQVFDKTILMGTIGSFDTPLGLWGMSVDAVDTKTLHRLAKRG